MTNEVRDLIVKHSFESPTALRTALLVHYAFPAIRHKLIERTLSGIKAKVIKLTGADWETSLDAPAQGFYLRLRRSNWHQALQITIEKEKPEPDTWISVTRPSNGLMFESQLYKGLKEGIPSITPGPTHARYVWYGHLDRFRYWDNPETMLALAEGEEAQAHMSELLAAVASIVDRIIAESQHVHNVETAAAQTPDQAG